MPDAGSSGIQTPDFSPELLQQTREHLRELLGSVWGRIEYEDAPSRPDQNRHLLAVLDHHAGLFAEDYAAARFPGHLPDFMALYLVVQVLGRMREDPVFREVLPGLADRGEFRHHMLTLGLADHFRLYTPYPVSLPTHSPTGERIVDLIIGTEPRLDVETKSAEEFDGPRRHVSSSNAQPGIRKAWRSAFGGTNPQLRDDWPSLVLVGGVTVDMASVPTIVRAAEAWLARKGAEHPNCWGILVMTYLTVSRLPPGRRVGDGAPLTINVLASPFLVPAKNPSYRGPVQLVFTPPVW